MKGFRVTKHQQLLASVLMLSFLDLLGDPYK